MSNENETKKKILMVEDDVGVQYAVKRLLSFYEIEIIQAYTLDEAEDLFIEHHKEIDLVVLDGCVPGRILNTIYLIDIFKDVREDVIIWGASGNPEYNEQLLNAGCHFTTNKIDVVDSILKHFNFTRSDY
jgi:DNA-binding NarL/FixJ family response regulator